MSFPSNSFFDVYVTLTFVVVFIGVLLTTFIAPINIFPASLLYPKYVEVCDPRCHLVEVPINVLWGGLINGGTYAIIVTSIFLVLRAIRRKKKK